uniref:Uncharacterized protein n=1 Tax=Lactuca sativa TaxID=4236 RepID=A0A9R1UUK0_LACSA|nr:hypothetical protein LSAT_V11C800402650 [Lactuca sativa]
MKSLALRKKHPQVHVIKQSSMATSQAMLLVMIMMMTMRWDVAIGDTVIKAAWEQKAKERYRQRKGVVGGKAPPTHNGGLTSHQQIVADMYDNLFLSLNLLVIFGIYLVLMYEEYTGKALSCYELFMFTRTNDCDRKTFQVDKAKEVHDLFVSRRADLALLGEEVPENELFYTAVGGHDRKKKVYGLGSYGMSIFREKSSQRCTSPDTSFEKHHLETKIQKLEETIDQQRMELDDVRNMVTDMRSTNNH